MAAKSIALHGAGAAGRWRHAPPKLTPRRPGAVRGDAGRWRLRARAPPSDRIQFQFNPEGTVDLEVGEVGALERARRQDCGAAGVQRSRPLQAHSRALLRRHRHAWTAASSPASSSCSPAACRPTTAWPRRRPCLRWSCCSGATVKSFAAFVTSVQAKYTLFTGEGTPIRATCNVSLEEMPGDPRKQNPTSGGLTLTSVRTVVAGDSLASIAYREYGDPAMWRPLAAVQRHRRPAAAAARRSRAPARRRRPRGRECDVAEAQVSNAFTVTIDGTPLPADLVPLLVSADVDDSLNLPDLVILRFRDAGPHGARQVQHQDRGEARGRGDEQGRRPRRSR